MSTCVHGGDLFMLDNRTKIQLYYRRYQRRASETNLDNLITESKFFEINHLASLKIKTILLTCLKAILTAIIPERLGRPTCKKF